MGNAFPDSTTYKVWIYIAVTSCMPPSVQPELVQVHGPQDCCPFVLYARASKCAIKQRHSRSCFSPVIVDIPASCVLEGCCRRSYFTSFSYSVWSCVNHSDRHYAFSNSYLIDLRFYHDKGVAGWSVFRVA